MRRLNDSNGCCLYRHFDKDGVLLYVGISNDVRYRTDTHRKISRWFLDIAKITVTHFPSRDDALVAEKRAIKEETPKFNIVGRETTALLFTANEIEATKPLLPPSSPAPPSAPIRVRMENGELKVDEGDVSLIDSRDGHRSWIVFMPDGRFGAVTTRPPGPGSDAFGDPILVADRATSRA